LSNNKTALIIGASRGLGLGLVKQLTEQSWKVIATVRDQQKATDLKAIPGIRIETLDMDDVTSQDALKRTLQGQVFDVVVINAGIMGPRPQSVEEVTTTELTQLFLTNAIAPIRLAERLVQQIRPGSGVLAFMSSRFGSITCPDGADAVLYKASKAALNSLTNSFVVQLPEPRPTVLSLHPGWVKTDMGGDAASIDVETSTRGMVEQLNAYAGKGGHYFVNYKGETIPW
jgi:short-subunit dehydrogenase